MKKKNAGVLILDQMMVIENKIASEIFDLLDRIEDVDKKEDILESEIIVKVQLIVEGNFNEFDAEKKRKLQKQLALDLGLDEKEIKILFVLPGSIKVVISLPKKSAEKLLDYLHSGQIKDLKFNNTFNVITINNLTEEEFQLITAEVLSQQKKMQASQKLLTKKISVNKNRFLIESRVLLSLLQKTGTDSKIWEITLKKLYDFLSICLRQLQNKTTFSDIDIPSKILAEFEFLIRDRIIDIPLEGNLILYFIEVSTSILIREKVLEIDESLVESQSKIPNYLESEILLQLLKENDEFVQKEIFIKYRKLIWQIVDQRYSLISRSEFESFYNIAMAEGYAYMAHSLQPPLKASLFTIFTRIIRNKIINDEKSYKKKFILELDNSDEASFNIESTSVEYVDFLRQKHEGVIKLFPENDIDLIQKILDLLPPEAAIYLRMRFIDGMSYEQMVKQLSKEGIKTSAGVLRKRIFDALIKARKILGVK